MKTSPLSRYCDEPQNHEKLFEGDEIFETTKTYSFLQIEVMLESTFE